jgi:hypothetical protein
LSQAENHVENGKQNIKSGKKVAVVGAETELFFITMLRN